MKLTGEQFEVVKYDFKRYKTLKVQAFAGAGKSSTIMEYIKNNPNKKILYLVYNRSMKRDAEKMFKGCTNVQILTIHGLAFRYTARDFITDEGVSTIVDSYNRLDLLEDLGYARDDYLRMPFYEELYNLYTMFLNSGYKDVVDFIKSQSLSHLKQFTINEITAKIREVCNLKYRKLADCEHDFYLKMFHKKSPSLKEYDVVIVDEAQDISGVLLDILKNIDTNIIVVGDKYQNIYGWRHTVNAMEELQGDLLPLSNSFRIGQETADVCNNFIDAITGDKVDIKGVNNSQKIVKRVDRSKQYARLYRYNFGLMDVALDHASNGKSIYFIGGIKGYPFSDLLSLRSFQANPKKYKFRTRGLMNTQPKMITGFAKFLLKFEDFKDVMGYAKQHNDIKMQSYIKTIFKARSENRDLFKEYNTLKDQTTNRMEDADVILSTIHKSKGATLGNVIVSDDVMNMCEFQTKKDAGDYFDEDLGQKIVFNKYEYFEEMYVLYVAITRAKGDLELPMSLTAWLESQKK